MSLASLFLRSSNLHAFNFYFGSSSTSAVFKFKSIYNLQLNLFTTNLHKLPATTLQILHHANARFKSSRHGSIQPSSTREQNALAERSRRLLTSIRVLEGATGNSEHSSSPMPFSRAKALADERNLLLVEVCSNYILNCFRTLHYFITEYIPAVSPGGRPIRATCVPACGRSSCA